MDHDIAATPQNESWLIAKISGDIGQFVRPRHRDDTVGPRRQAKGIVLTQIHAMSPRGLGSGVAQADVDRGIGLGLGDFDQAFAGKL